MATGDPWAFSEKMQAVIGIHRESTIEKLPERMIRCEYCRRKVSDIEPFCPSCGAPLPDEPFDEKKLFLGYHPPSTAGWY